MRKVIVASLALLPVLLHAQTNSSVQPQAPSTLQSKLAAPATIGSSARGPQSGLRVSTGVVAPKLIYTVAITSDTSRVSKLPLPPRTTVVAMLVDTDGKPKDLKIVRSISPLMDQNVLEAVKQYRFTPGTVSDVPTAIPFNLNVIINSPTK
jgi:TonB family protein